MPLTTITRAAIDGDKLALVVSVNPFSNIKHPTQAAPAAHYQTYDVHPNGRTTLRVDDRYDNELEAAERFDREHGE